MSDVTVTEIEARLLRCRACPFQRVLFQSPGESDEDFYIRVVGAEVTHAARHTERREPTRPDGVSDEQWAQVQQRYEQLRGGS